MKENPILEAANTLLSQGVSIIPIDHSTKRPLWNLLPQEPDPEHPGKLKATWKPYQKALATPEEKGRWFGPAQALAVVGGEVSGGLEIIDFDVEGYFERWREVVGSFADNLPIQRTGGGGYQVFLRTKEPKSNQKLAWHPDETEDTGRTIAIETRGEGGYAVVPPSIHPNGNQYAWVTPFDGTIPKIQTIRRDALFDAARSLCQAPYTLKELERQREKEQQAEARYKARMDRGEGDPIITAFNRDNSISDLLLQHGYTGSGERLKRPGGKSASVTISKQSNISWHHSSNDPLNPISEARGVVTPFDVHCYFVFGLDPSNASDVSEAVKRLAPPGTNYQRTRSSYRQKSPGVGEATEAPPPTLREVEQYIDALDVGDLSALNEALAKLAPMIAAQAPQDQAYLFERVAERGISRGMIKGLRKTVELANKAPAQSEVAKEAASRGEWRHDPNAGVWHKYVDGVWEPSTTASAKLAVMGFCEAICPGGYSNGFVDGVLGLLQTHTQHTVWNNKDNMIPCDNGVLDLEAMEIKEYRPDYNFTWKLPYPYTPGADCPKIKAWLHEAMQGDPSLVKALRAWLAAIVRGRSDLQKFVECIGEGGSGKGTFQRLASALVGERNVFVTTISSLESNRFGTVGIIGKRLLLITDAEKWQGGVDTIKAITGGDAIPVEQKNEKVTGHGYTPRCLVLMAGNQPLQSNDHTSGVIRRRVTVPFNLKVDEKKKRNLEAEFAPELPGLLNWILELSNAEITEALTFGDNESLRAARNTTLLQVNPVGDWFRDNVAFDPTAITPVGVYRHEHGSVLNKHTHLYPNYRVWCEEMGRHHCAGNKFSQHLKTLVSALGRDVVFVERDTDKANRAAHFRGITLRGDGDEFDGETPPTGDDPGPKTQPSSRYSPDTSPIVSPILSPSLSSTSDTSDTFSPRVRKEEIKTEVDPQGEIVSLYREDPPKVSEVSEVVEPQGSSVGRVSEEYRKYREETEPLSKLTDLAMQKGYPRISIRGVGVEGKHAWEHWIQKFGTDEMNHSEAVRLLSIKPSIGDAA